MEMLEGQSLTELLNKEQPGVARAVGIIRQVCDALQAAHEVGVIHRDVKPDNLFVLERDGRDFVKVLDFGVAKLVAPLGDVPMTTTVEGTIVGTPAYMAPEQATGGNADARTDLYSVGVVLYELLAGHPPFQAPAFGQLVAQVLSSPPPPLPAQTRSGERIPHALWAVVKRCPGEEPRGPVPLAARAGPGARGGRAGPGAARAAALDGGGRSAGGAGAGAGGGDRALDAPDRGGRAGGHREARARPGAGGRP
jgi:serine/threonine-protein kinase